MKKTFYFLFSEFVWDKTTLYYILKQLTNGHSWPLKLFHLYKVFIGYSNTNFQFTCSSPDILAKIKTGGGGEIFLILNACCNFRIKNNIQSLHQRLSMKEEIKAPTNPTISLPHQRLIYLFIFSPCDRLNISLSTFRLQ